MKIYTILFLTTLLALTIAKPPKWAAPCKDTCGDCDGDEEDPDCADCAECVCGMAAGACLDDENEKACKAMMACEDAGAYDNVAKKVLAKE